LPVVLPASTGQGLQISAQLARHDGQIFYSLLFENNTQIALDGFLIQFNKNTFGLAAAGPLTVVITLFFLFLLINTWLSGIFLGCGVYFLTLVCFMDVSLNSHIAVSLFIDF
jgi:hypothetical protein